MLRSNLVLSVGRKPLRGHSITRPVPTLAGQRAPTSWVVFLLRTIAPNRPVDLRKSVGPERPHCDQPLSISGRTHRSASWSWTYPVKHERGKCETHGSQNRRRIHGRSAHAKALIRRAAPASRPSRHRCDSECGRIDDVGHAVAFAPGQARLHAQALGESGTRRSIDSILFF